MSFSKRVLDTVLLYDLLYKLTPPCPPSVCRIACFTPSSPSMLLKTVSAVQLLSGGGFKLSAPRSVGSRGRRPLVVRVTATLIGPPLFLFFDRFLLLASALLKRDLFFRAAKTASGFFLLFKELSAFPLPARFDYFGWTRPLLLQFNLPPLLLSAYRILL